MTFSKKDKFVVRGFEESCPQSFKDKIIAMGVIEGQELVVTYKSMIGGPIAFETNCGMFSLRKKDLELLKLENIN